MKKLGITGRMSSGKTFIANLFAKKLKETGNMVSVISVDNIRRGLIADNKELQKRLAFEFGIEIGPDGINRAELSKKVFINKTNISLYNSIVNPYIRNELERQIELFDGDYLLLEWAMLVEDGYLDLVNYNVLAVVCEEEIILKRLGDSDLSLAEIQERLRCQTNWSENKNKLKTICCNNGGQAFFVNTDCCVDENIFKELI